MLMGDGRCGYLGRGKGPLPSAFLAAEYSNARVGSEDVEKNQGASKQGLWREFGLVQMI